MCPARVMCRVHVHVHVHVHAHVHVHVHGHVHVHVHVHVWAASKALKASAEFTNTAHLLDGIFAHLVARINNEGFEAILSLSIRSPHLADEKVGRCSVCIRIYRVSESTVGYITCSWRSSSALRAMAVAMMSGVMGVNGPGTSFATCRTQATASLTQVSSSTTY